MKLCVDLGATNVKSALIQNYKIERHAVTPTDTVNGRAGVVQSLRRAVDALLREGVTEICISSAGRIDSATGKVVYATDNLPDYTGFDIVSWVCETYGLPSVALGDGFAALLGEIAGTPEYAEKRVAMLTLGSGVGGAYAVNGVIEANEKNDFAFFGHIVLHENGTACNCGKVGCAEQYLSGRAINRAAERFGIEKDAVFHAYAAGNPSAKKVVDGLRDDLSRLLAKIRRVSPFEICLLGGGVVDGMGESFDEITRDLGYDIRRAKAGNCAGLIGAYYFSEKGNG